jgi:choline dehydrogenase-like flavoprotein
MEGQLSIAPWPVPPNENNDVLARGGAALQVPTAAIRRNVKGCWNLGYCGMGCPTNAKQSMLVTTLPSALAKGATLMHRARVLRLERAGSRITGCEIAGLPGAGVAPGAWRVRARARHFVVCAGAIGSPALLLRSDLPDPHRVAGKRTFLHPVVISAAMMDRDVAAWAGAPQTVYSDHFLDSVALEGPIGYKLEAAPMHPLLAAISLQGFGKDHQSWMARLPKIQAMIALMRDGFSAQSQGGSVELLADGSPVLDYPLDDYFWDGARRAFASMAEIQFAAGAKVVMPVHEDAPPYRTWAAAKAGIAALPMGLLRTRVVSAHVMGGCPLGNDPRSSVVDERGRHHQVENLSVHDGSLFPTSIGANPQLSIYAIASRMAVGLAGALTGNGTA